jgi:hypothetical protein
MDELPSAEVGGTTIDDWGARSRGRRGGTEWVMEDVGQTGRELSDLVLEATCWHRARTAGRTWYDFNAMLIVVPIDSRY